MTTDSPLPHDPDRQGKGTPNDPFEPDAVFGPDGRRADGYSSNFSSSFGNHTRSFTEHSDFIGLGSLLSDSPVAAVFSKSSRWLTFTGVIATIVGIVVALWPHAGISVFAWATGTFAILVGSALTWFGLTTRSIPILPKISAIVGVILLIGLGSLIAPQRFGVIIVIMIGIMALIHGIATVSAGRVASRISGTTSNVTWTGMFSIIVGIVFIVAPLTSLYSLTALLGLMLAAFGVMMVIAGVRGRQFFLSSRR